MAIVLIGPPAAGKSSLGRALAAALELPFTDTDAMIERKFGPPQRLIAQEARFRQLETFCLRRALRRGGVIATGGGAVLVKTNQALIRRHTVILLSIEPEQVAARLDRSRPLTADLPAWEKVYAARRPIYESLADATLAVGKRRPASLAADLVRLLKSRFAKQLTAAAGARRIT